MTDTPTQSWFQQRWKWLIPVGCLGTLLLAIAWGVFIVFFVLAGAKSSDAYRGAVAAVESSPEALAALGSPIEIGWWMMGSIDVNGPSGDGDTLIHCAADGSTASPAQLRRAGTRPPARLAGTNFDLLPAERR